MHVPSSATPPGFRHRVAEHAASGALREIDRIATNALRAAARKKRKLVERDILTRLLEAADNRATEVES